MTNSLEKSGKYQKELLRLHDELKKRNAEIASLHASLRETQRQFDQRVDERTRELSTLLRVSQNITSTLDLEPLLGLILDQLKLVVEYQLASISILEKADELVLLAVRGQGMPQIGTRFPLSKYVNARNTLINREPSFVPKLDVDEPLANYMRDDLAKQNLAGLGSWMSAPLIFRDKSIGILNLAHTNENYYNPARVELAMAFANQAATAIENSRLYEQSLHLASLQERQKLARELHDSVSQALYGIALGAQTARAQLELNPSKVAEPLDYIMSLAEVGLSEMRALIFELRPESLQSEGLVAALTKQADAQRARYKMNVITSFCPEPDVSLDVKETLYRIAQEALHNVAKHASSTQVELTLQATDGRLLLEIRDNGKGFTLEETFPGHLGLQSMRERVANLGGEIRIYSRPGEGTYIIVNMKSHKE